MSTTRPRLAKTKARGYGGVHKRERQRWARAVERGEVDCAHCRQLIEPDEPWDLGHVDDDRTRYAGPEHTRCNRQPRARRDRERDARTDPDPRPWTPGPEITSGSATPVTEPPTISLPEAVSEVDRCL